MATEDEVGTGDGVTANPTEQEGLVAHAVQLRKDVKAEVEKREAGGEVIAAIIRELADAEMKNRVAKLSKAFAKRDEMQRNLNKIQPDLVGYDANGKKVSETFSKPKFEELKKAREELTKLDAAIGKAVNKDKPDYDGLQKFIGG